MTRSLPFEPESVPVPLRPPVAERPLFKVLSLDGGGTWALLEIMTLMRLFPGGTGHDVLRCFDLVVATSGGASVAAGLATGLPLSEMYARFVDPDVNHRIFVPTLRYRLTGRLFPRYRTTGKLSGLRAALGPLADQPMHEFGVRHRGALSDIVISAYDYDRARARFFRTRHDTVCSAGAPLGATFAQAVHASGTAPVVYFDKPAAPLTAHPTLRFWDGAIAGYSNPILLGLTEALAYSDGNAPDRAQVRVLSLGSGQTRKLPPDTHAAAPELCERRKRTGLFSDMKALATSIFEDPPEAACFIAHVLLGHRLPSANESVTDGPVVRMSPLLAPIWNGSAWTRPSGLSARSFERLFALGFDAVRKADIGLVEEMGHAWMGDGLLNQPIRAAWPVTSAQIGHTRFSEAARAVSGWLSEQNESVSDVRA